MPNFTLLLGSVLTSVIFLYTFLNSRNNSVANSMQTDFDREILVFYRQVNCPFLLFKGQIKPKSRFSQKTNGRV